MTPAAASEPTANLAPPLPTTLGVAGASAAREYARRHARREERIDAKWGALAGAVKFLQSDPQSTTAWAVGADGERKLAAHLARRLADQAVVLNDLQVKGTKGNIDHLVIAPSGVWVVDAKNYQGRVERRDVGGWFKVDLRLYVGGRDRTRLVTGLDWQVAAVRGALDGLDVPVVPALCFTHASWSFFAKPFKVRSAWVTWADALCDLILAEKRIDKADYGRLLAACEASFRFNSA